MPDSLRAHGLQPTKLLCPWDFPGKNTGVGCYFLLKGIFLSQGSNLGFLHYMQFLYWLSYQGSPIRFSQNVKMRSQPSACAVLPGKIALPARSWFCGVLNVEENLSPILRLVMSEFQARPGCKWVSYLQFFLPNPASLLVNSTWTFRRVCACVFIFWNTEIWFIFSRAFFWN